MNLPEEFLKLVTKELEAARTQHASLNSLHEAYAVILEELDEFKEQVWLKSSKRDNKEILSELVQVAAMCARTAIDLKLLP